MAYTPIRTCVACRKKAPKGSLIRVGKDASGAVGINREGRGAYVCRDAKCVETALRRKLLVKPLRTDASSVDWMKLAEELIQVVSKNKDAEV
jgi:hypothetical protein